MASVDWKKLHSKGEVKAVLRHDCKDSREAATTHANEDIQRHMTVTNTGLLDGYATTVKAYDARMSELPPPVRKDAVVGLGFSIPMPEGLPKDKEDEWAEKVYGLMSESYGKENIVCYVVHRDEQHEYIDPDTKERRVSRPHIQGVMVPEVDGRLCAKEVTARGRMKAINCAIHTMTQTDYGLDFMDGSRSKSRGSVETLKQRSALAELEARNKELSDRNEELEKQVEGWGPKMVYKKARQRKEEAEQAAAEAEARQKAAEDRQAEAEKAAQEAVQRAEKARNKVKEYECTLKRQKAEGEALLRSLSDAVAKAERLEKALIVAQSDSAKPGVAGVVSYLLSNKGDDGRTLFEHYRDKAKRVSSRVSRSVKEQVTKARRPAKQFVDDFRACSCDDDELSM